ncbi:ATP-dependent nuclease [Streptomyces sp. FR-008]|uniref:ATP-dependent nuclease n=1 Tax=Streptomyces sp. FR-008 TaxID=206662 RepID=UPI00071FCE93|nr:AAA family ATPase [Streptomyces sp. FR-008]ALM43546.1 chromosome segregation protein SMC [Streptomyces sp. FR-008]KAF0794836.1 chromosome segregation protein SMC [Streptomyces sp. FR-008]
MKITTLRLSNFQSFGANPTSIDLDDVTYILGPNGAGKTAVLEALSRLFSPLEAQRKIRPQDFHAPVGQPAGESQAQEPVLWLEVDVEFPEAGDDGQHASVPAGFSHMAIDTADGVPQIRVRLTASLAPDGVVDERIEYVLERNAAGEPTRRADMPRYDRRHIEVHYLPARRDPADHLSYTAASLIGRTLRAADWTAQRKTLDELSTQITDSLLANPTVAGLGTLLTKEWHSLHRGDYFKDPSIAFGQGDLEGVLRLLTVTFSPTHKGAPLQYERLSDGQKSLLYISLVLAWQSLARRVLSGQETSLDPDRLRPPVHTVIALEEPENSLAPHYLGRIISQLRGACEHGDVQALIATHAPALLRRVAPHTIRFLRLNTARETTVRGIVLPEDGTLAAKYVREAVQAYPELYFSRFVVLGEGDSEQVVLPRVLAAADITTDDTSVSVVPLGGRHVNHFWRLLAELQIPHATLLDLDAGRHQAGWGRVRNARNQINAIRPGTYAKGQISSLPEWDDDRDFPKLGDPAFPPGQDPMEELERQGVFFSHPVDLDLMLLEAYPDAYGVSTTEPGSEAEPEEKTIVAVLGKSHVNEHRLPAEVRTLFGDYHALFDLGSKPAAHLEALADLDDKQLMNGLPDVLTRLVDYVRQNLAELPE